MIFFLGVLGEKLAKRTWDKVYKNGLSTTLDITIVNSFVLRSEKSQ